MPRRVPIQLKPEIIEARIKLAHARNAIKFDVANKRYASHISDEEMHTGGTITETGAGSYFGVDIDHSISKSGDDKVKDLIFPTLDWETGQIIPIRVAVKSRYNRPDGYLFFNDDVPYGVPSLQTSAFKADIAILVIYYPNHKMELIGWIDQESFHQHKFSDNFGHGWRVCVKQEHLEDLDLLLPHVVGDDAFRKNLLDSGTGLA